MATFWERATGVADPLDLDLLRTTLALTTAGTVTSANVALFLGFDAAQLAEFDALLTAAPTVELTLAAFNGARLGLPELDTIEKVKAALGVP